MALDKSEGTVKAQNYRAVFSHRVIAKVGGESKLWSSHGESVFGASLRRAPHPLSRRMLAIEFAASPLVPLDLSLSKGAQAKGLPYLP